MKTIDLKNKIKCDFVSDRNANYFKKDGQEFYFSPSKKQLHLAEKLPNGDIWIAKTWNTKNIIIM